MNINDDQQIADLRELFLEKCFDIVEKGVEIGEFRMKDVARYLGISSQVASKLVNPSNPRILTAFELFRMSILARRPVTDIIPMELYMTAEELKDTGLCEAVRSSTAGTSDASITDEAFNQLPEACRQCVLTLIRTRNEENRS